ncbi:hypothetical protein MRX96_051142 [Rhipicephalus microplus]
MFASKRHLLSFMEHGPDRRCATICWDDVTSRQRLKKPSGLQNNVVMLCGEVSTPKTPLYKYLSIKIHWNHLSKFNDNTGGADGNVECDVGEIEQVPEVTDLDDPMQATTTLNTISHSMIFDDGASGVIVASNCNGVAAENCVALSTARKAAARTLDGLIRGTHSLHVAPGEGQGPNSLLFHMYAEELSFSQYTSATRA